MTEMTSDSSDESLDCETILRERNEWVFNENELNAKEGFEKVLNSIRNKESFLYSIISFLNNYSSNSDLTDIDMNRKYGYYKHF